MIETKVPKDIRVYETKIIGPFSLRQAVCFLLLIFLDILIYSFMINPFSISADYAVYLLCLVDIPVAAFGFVKVMGVPREKYLDSVIKSLLYTIVRNRSVRSSPFRGISLTVTSSVLLLMFSFLLIGSLLTLLTGRSVSSVRSNTSNLEAK